MTCRECVEVLMDFLSGEMDEASCEQFRQHMEQCPPCVAYFESYQITVKISRELPAVELPPEVAERLQKALKNIKP